MLRILRIMVAALAFGMVSSTAVFAFVRSRRTTVSSETDQVFLVVMGVFGIGCFVGWIVFQRLKIGWLRRQWPTRADTSNPEGDLVHPFFTLHLTGAALSEASGLLAAVVYLLNGHLLALAVVLVALYALSRFYPRDDSYGRFVGLVTGARTDPA